MATTTSTWPLPASPRHALERVRVMLDQACVFGGFVVRFVVLVVFSFSWLVLWLFLSPPSPQVIAASHCPLPPAASSSSSSSLSPLADPALDSKSAELLAEMEKSWAVLSGLRRQLHSTLEEEEEQEEQEQEEQQEQEQYHAPDSGSAMVRLGFLFSTAYAFVVTLSLSLSLSSCPARLPSSPTTTTTCHSP